MAGRRDDYREAQEYSLGLAPEGTVRLEGGCQDEVRLGRLLGRGAVGRLFAVEGSGWLCVKVFDRPGVARAEKVRELARKYRRGELRPRTAAWPRGVVVSPQGVAVGYLMDRVEGPTLASLAADPEVGLAERARVAEGFAKRIAECHGSGSDPEERMVVVGDVSLANCVLCDKTGEPRLVDVDAFQVASCAGGVRRLYPVGEQHTSSPETVGRDLGGFALTSRNDSFLCAEGCFELLLGCDPLMDGTTEEDGCAEDARERAVRNRLYPYLASAGALGVADPGEVVGSELSGLFMRSFSGSYEEVPTASDYAEALARLEDAPVGLCPTCGGQWVAYASDTCPHCAAAERRRAWAPPRTVVAPAPVPSPAPAAPGHADDDSDVSQLPALVREFLAPAVLLVVAVLAAAFVPELAVGALVVCLALLVRAVCRRG